MKLIPEWIRGGNDRELATTRYAGRPSASDRAATKRAQRGSLGRPHRNARDADRAGAAWESRQR